MTFAPSSLLRLALAGACVLATAGAAAAGTAPATPTTTFEARVIVKYRADATRLRALSTERGADNRPQYAQALGERLKRPLRNGRILGRHMQALGGSGMSSQALATELASQPEVEWAVPDMRRYAAALPNDPYLPAGQTTITPAAGQWYLRTPDSTTPAAIDAVGAWEITRGNPAITVAVLDTGVVLGHPDLASKLRPGYDFVSTADISNDGDGRDADPGDPGDWTTTNECSFGQAAMDSRWHGTQVAGLIGAATNNGTGMASVGHDIGVLPVRVLGRCGGYDSDIIAAMRWAAGISNEVGTTTPRTVVNANPARVINMSLGSEGSCLASWREAIAELNEQGVAVVVAAGNDAGLAISTPANCAGAIAVTGIRHSGSKVGYSNVGPEAALAAPAGNCVNLSGTCLYPLLTTSNSGTTSPQASIYTGGGANATLGTSFSAPLVAGAVGLMLSVNPALSPERVKELLQASARPFPTTGGEAGTAVCRAPGRAEQLECYCTTSTCGAGMLDVRAAVARAPEPSANIDSPTTATQGSSITLSAAASGVGAGRTIISYQWSIVSGANFASFSGPTNGATATLVIRTTATAQQASGMQQALATTVGNVVVQLAVTDNLGATDTSSRALAVTTADTGTPGGGGGGGALHWGAMLALAAACLLARRSTRRG